MENTNYINSKEYIYENSVAFARYNSSTHKDYILIVSKKHINNLYDLKKHERDAVFNILEKCKTLIIDELKANDYIIRWHVDKAVNSNVLAIIEIIY